jgi:hypothetical protein
VAESKHRSLGLNASASTSSLSGGGGGSGYYQNPSGAGRNEPAGSADYKQSRHYEAAVATVLAGTAPAYQTKAQASQGQLPSLNMNSITAQLTTSPFTSSNPL